MSTQTRKSLFDYMNLETRQEYLAHRQDFDKNGTRWQLTERSKELLLRAKEVSWDVETIPEPPPGTYKHLTDGVRSSLGLTYLTDITHIAFYAVVDDEEVIVVLVAPFMDEEESFARQLISKNDKLDIGHNQAFDVRIWCGHHDTPVPENTYCTLVGQTTMMGGPNSGYPDGSSRSLDSLMKMYDVMDKILPYVADAAIDWAETRLHDYELLIDTQGLATQDEYLGYIGTHADISQIRTALSRDSYKLMGIIEAWQKFMKKNRNVLHTLPAKWVAAYAASDSIGTYWVYRKQLYYSKILQEQYGYTELWNRHREDQRYQNILNRWAVRGIPVNREWIEKQLLKIRAERERWIPYFAARGCGDLTKNEHKHNFIFHVCEAPEPDPWEYVEFSDGKGKWYPADMQGQLWSKAGKDYIQKHGWEDDRDYSNYYSTSNKALAYYIKYGPEEHRSKLKLYEYYTSMLSQESTYREWLDHSSYDGKVHPVLTMTANTGRTITGTPNIQNVNMHYPSEIEVYDPLTDGVCTVTEFTGLGMIKPHDGKVLLEFDASNAEVRTGAVIARAKRLCQMFADHVDMHKTNAALFNNKDFEDVTKQERSDGKPVFFGFQYGATPRTVASMPAVLKPTSVIEPMVTNWFNKNWEIKVAQQRIEQEGWKLFNTMNTFPLPAARQVYTVLFNGRWVPAPTYWGRPKTYTLWNSQQQGGVGAIAVPAIINSHDYFQAHPELGADILLMVHDSIIIEVPDDNWEAVVEAGEYVAMQLMIQVPFELTVVDGVAVPWPSGCDLYENQYKWGWQPDRDFPYPCGSDEGEVVITYPEPDAWQIMLDKALDRIREEGRQAERDLKDHYQSFPFRQIPWILENDEIDPCISKNSALQYSIEKHEAQSRKWGLLEQLGDLNEEWSSFITGYRAWVARASQLHVELKEVIERYEQTKRTGEDVIGQTS